MTYPKEFNDFIESLPTYIKAPNVVYLMYTAWLDGQTVATKAAIESIKEKPSEEGLKGDAK